MPGSFHQADKGDGDCADVLSLFGPADQQGRMGEVVRRFFAAADESRFATSPGAHVEVFPLKSELNTLLSKLQERL